MSHLSSLTHSVDGCLSDLKLSCFSRYTGEVRSEKRDYSMNFSDEVPLGDQVSLRKKRSEIFRCVTYITFICF